MFELDEFLDHFEKVRQRTRRVAACIPVDRVEWTYKPGAFTLGDLVRHVAVAERQIWAETRSRSAAPLHDARTRARRRPRRDSRVLDRLHQESLALFRALTPERLQSKYATPEGTRITMWKWLRMMPEHEIHHRGQIYTLLGMLDVPTPPLYGMTATEVQARAGT